MGQLPSQKSAAEKLKIMQKKLNQKIGRTTNPVLWCVMAAFVSTLNLGAEGFRNPPPGAFNLGRAGGRIAQVDDSSAVQQNPANLVDLTNAEAQLAPTIVYIRSSFEGTSGQSARTIDSWKLLPNFFVSVPLKEDKVAIGLGVTVPYGLGIEWDRNSSAFAPGGVFSGSPYFSQLTTINVNPTLSVRLCEQVSIGVGFDAMWSKLEFKQFAPPPFPGGTELKADGDGFGYGGNVGITWQITDKQRIAVTYRSPLTVNYDGSWNASTFASGNFNSQIKFPTIVSVGYGVQLPHNIRLETDVEWLQFSQFKSLPANLSGLASLNTPENWKDTFTAGIGGDWKFADNWVLRGGYQFYQSPVPDSTFSPMIPDADQNVITIGIGWKGKHNSLEAAYGLDFYNTRNINNPAPNNAFNGKYTFNVHLFSLAYRYSF